MRPVRPHCPQGIEIPECLVDNGNRAGEGDPQDAGDCVESAYATRPIRDELRRLGGSYYEEGRRPEAPEGDLGQARSLGRGQERRSSEVENRQKESPSELQFLEGL